MKRLQEYVLAAVIFLTPSTLFLKFVLESNYIRGIFVDYLVPKVHLSTIFIVFFIVVTVQLKRKNIYAFTRNRLAVLTAAMAFLLVIRQFFTTHPVPAFYAVVQYSLTAIFARLLYMQHLLFKSRVVQMSFIGALLFQSLLGVYQFFTQSSLAGYWLLGEPEVRASIGIVRQQLLGKEVALPYGTTAHPNVLAGVIVIYLMISFLNWWRDKNKTAIYSWSFYLTVPSALLCLWLTQSSTALASLLIGIFVILIAYLRGQKKPVFTFVTMRNFIWSSLLVAILVPIGLSLLSHLYTTSSSVYRRDILNIAAVEMFTKNPVVGIGSNQFTVQVQEYAELSEVIRFVQPAHHIGLLWVSETGILGVLLVVMLLVPLIKKNVKISAFFYVLLPLAVLDHYLLTLQTGLLLMVISSVFLYHFSEEK